jgi:DNA-binding response OmpR family regulator
MDGIAQRVLLVDENWMFREGAAVALKRAGFDVVQVTTPKIALELMEREGADVAVVISEVRFRDRSTGQSVIAAMRKFRGELKVIFTSGYPDDAKGLPEGDVYVAKPCRERELVTAVQRLLRDSNSAHCGSTTTT